MQRRSAHQRSRRSITQPDSQLSQHRNVASTRSMMQARCTPTVAQPQERIRAIASLERLDEMYIAATTRAQKNSRITPPYYGVVSHHEVAKLSL
jgi:hypothetical protein